MENPDIWLGGKEVAMPKGVKKTITLKNGKEVKPTNIAGQTTFYHASKSKRIGRLSPNQAPQWGKAVYFATNRQNVIDEFGDKNVTEVNLNLQKPLYVNSKDFEKVREKAIELYSRSQTPKILEEQTYKEGGETKFYDEDAQKEYEKNGYLRAKNAESEIEEDANWVNQAARELGYDAIIDLGNEQYGSEIAVLDEKAVIYPEEIESKEGKEVAMPKGPYVPEVLPAANEQQKAGEKEVEALKKGDKITTKNPILLLKGIEGKKLPDGTPFTAHDGVKGTFSAIKEKIARRYEGEKGILVFEIPAGVTVEAVQVMSTPESKGVAGSIVRKMEVDAINASDAQVVKLITTDSRGSETQYIIKDPALRKLGYRPSEKAAEKQDPVIAFLRSQRSDPNVLGLNAALWNGFLMAVEKAWIASKSAAKAFQAGINFLKDKKENLKEWEQYINPVKERLQKLEQEEAGKKEAPEAPPVTPPKAEKKEEKKETKRELPEGEEEETEKPILGRAFRGTTDEAIAEKLAAMGLYRTPANIEEAFEIGQQLVDSLGTDKAIELGTKGEVPNGLVRIGILKAVLADINKQRDALKIGDDEKGEQKYLDALDELNDKYAEALAAFSPSLTESGQVLRAWQEVIKSAEFEFDYEGRKTRYKTLFGDEAYTEEVDERFKEYDRKLKEANEQAKQLQDKIDALEAQGIVDDIGNQAQEEKKEKKPISFFKQAAERVRKLKFSRPGIFSAATPASLAWDATIEAVATVLDASGTLEQAIVAGVKKLKSTDWYKSLNASKQSQAEKELSGAIKDSYIIKATVDDNGKIQIPSGLLRSYVTSGIKDANDIIADIASYLQEGNPEITESDVRSAILERGKKEAPKASEITKNVNTLKSIIRMIGQLEQVEKGKRITKGEGKKKDVDKTIASLKKQIEQKHIEQFGVKPGALTDEQRLANIKKNALQRIADMKAMKPRPEPRERVKWDAEMNRIGNEEFRIKEKWNQDFKEAERKKKGAVQKFFRGAYLTVNFSKTIMTGIGDLGVLLIQGSMLPFRSASVTKEAIANMGRAFLSQEQYVEQLRKINESELYRVVRKSGLDLPQITSLEIEKIEESNLGALGETIFDVMFLPFKYVPKIGPKMYEWAKNHLNVARVFNRTQTAYMNTLRYGSFALSAQNLMEKGISFQDNPKSYQDVAAMINTMSGRTKLIGEESPAVMRGLNLAFYSPKNWASQIKMFTPVILWHVGRRRADSIGVLGMSEAQQTFIRTYASWIATSAALMFVLKAMTDGEDEDEEKKRETGNVSIDWENPQSSAFNKIRIGNQVFDPWGGKQQIITLQARLIIHAIGGRAFKDPYTGMEKTLEETPRFKHPLGLMNEYAKGKFSPYMSAAVKLLSSQRAKGKEWNIRQPSEGGPDFNILDPVTESYTNITYSAIKDLYGVQPLTIAEVMTLFLVAGGGITTLNDQEGRTIVSQIRESINPEEDEKRRYAANMASRLKDGDVEGAATVYDEAMGIKGVTDSRKAVKLRREGANKMYESASKDVVAQRYGVDDMYRKYLFETVYQNKPIPVSSSMSAKKKQVLDALNALTPEQKKEIKVDYDYRYEEFMNVAKGIDKLTSQPNKYEKRASSEYWVRQYKKATGKK
jgi:hypothetical protein